METKKLLFKGVCLFFLLLITQASYALPITWLGGNGDWMVAANWDTGVVPTSADDVTINSGTVKVRINEMAEAEFLVLGSAGVLKVFVGGTLTLGNCVGEHAFLNEGRAYIWGDLIIDNVTSSSGVRNGIKNEYYFFVGVNGNVEISAVSDGNGINNISTGYFLNRGVITMTDIGSECLRNDDRFRNTGSINLNDVSTTGIVNNDNFINYASGIINTTNGATGFLNGYSPALVKNYGEINTLDAVYGITNRSLFTNYPAGEILTTNCNYGFNNLAGSHFTNKGGFRAFTCSIGINNYAHINNQGTLGLYAPNDNGILNNAGSTFDNKEQIVMYGSTYALSNKGDFTNTADGLIYCYDKVKTSLSSTTTNDGFFISDFVGTHYTDATSIFENNGVISDNKNSFTSGNVTNLQVLISRIVGPMQDGVLFVDPIEIVSTSNITFYDWTDDFYGAINEVGDYDDVNNEFLPNSNAIGLSQFFIDIGINTSGQRNFCQLHMDNIVSAFERPNKNEIKTLSRSRDVADNTISTYPNPFSGTMIISGELVEDTATDVYIYDAIGNRVRDFRYTAINSDKFEIELPKSCASGFYIIQAIQDGRIVGSQSVLLQR